MSEVGVLALQGNFKSHCDILLRLGVSPREVLTSNDLAPIAALLIPGGESTSIIRLIQRAKMFQPLVEFARQKPVFGTCAGSILMAKQVVDCDYPTLAAIDIEIQRNAYGRQVASQIDSIEFDGGQLEVAFIRAPKIIAVADSETVLATWRESPVIVRNDRHMLATCHPEVLGNEAVHDYFLREFVV